MAIESIYPAVQPSLDLNFAAGNFDPRITFSRASAATYYDGKTVAKAEENLLKYSQDFTSWYKPTMSVTGLYGTAPDGSQTACLLTETLTNAIQTIQPSPATVFLANTAYTYSCFAKAVDSDYLVLAARGTVSNYVSATFNLVTGAVTSTSALGTGFLVTFTSIVNVGNGWYRCVLGFSTGANATSSNNYIGGWDGVASIGSSGTYTYTGTGESILIWGAQLEQRSQVTAYTPTTTQPITNYIPVLQTAPANVPRIDNDPVTDECKGLLIEEQRTNLLTYSEQIGTGPWTYGDVLAIGSGSIADCQIAPDGSATADLIVPSKVSSNVHYVRQGFASTIGNTYTFSVYVKAAGYSSVALRMLDTDASIVTYDLAQGTVNNAAATITAVGNGWFRCTLKGTSTGSSTGVYIYPNQQATYQGDGYSGVYVWGAQLEAGSFPTSYVKTTTSQATRAADTAQMIGTNFSSWYRQDEGTLFGEALSNVFTDTEAGMVTSSLAIAAIYNTVSRRSNGLVMGREDSGTAFAVAAVRSYDSSGNSTTTINAGNGSFSPSIFTKMAAAFSSTGSAFAVKGAASLLGLAQQKSEANTLAIGYGADTAYQTGRLNGCVKRLVYYPKRLTDAQLQAITV